MNLFTKKCECGATIIGPRFRGRASGAWLGYDECTKCRKKEADDAG